MTRRRHLCNYRLFSLSDYAQYLLLTYFNSFMTKCDFLEFRNDLLILTGSKTYLSLAINCGTFIFETRSHGGPSEGEGLCHIFAMCRQAKHTALAQTLQTVFDSLPSSFRSFRLIIWFIATTKGWSVRTKHEEVLHWKLHWGLLKWLPCQVYLCSLPSFTFSFESGDLTFIVGNQIQYKAWGFFFSPCRKSAHEHPQTKEGRRCCVAPVKDIGQERFRRS